MVRKFLSHSARGTQGNEPNKLVQWKTIGFMKGEQQEFQLTEAESKVFERKLTKLLNAFQKLFAHLRFPPGSRLEMHGNGCRSGVSPAGRVGYVVSAAGIP